MTLSMPKSVWRCPLRVIVALVLLLLLQAYTAPPLIRLHVLTPLLFAAATAAAVLGYGT